MGLAAEATGDLSAVSPSLCDLPILMADLPSAQDPCYTYPVSNLTLSLDADTLRRARIRALEQGTSVNAVVREFLAAYAGDAETEARQTVLALARASRAGSDASNGSRSWARPDAYEVRTRWPRS